MCQDEPRLFSESVHRVRAGEICVRNVPGKRKLFNARVSDRQLLLSFRDLVMQKDLMRSQAMISRIMSIVYMVPASLCRNPCVRILNQGLDMTSIRYECTRIC